MVIMDLSRFDNNGFGGIWIIVIVLLLFLFCDNGRFRFANMFESNKKESPIDLVK